jgi:hypothetical protein
MAEKSPKIVEVVTPLTDELVAQMLPLELAQVIVENSVFTPDVSPRPKPK